MTETFIVGRNTRIYDTARIVKADHEITIGDNCLIGDDCFIGPRKLVMKDGSQIAPHAILSGGGEIYLGKNSVVGFNSMLICATDTVQGQYMNEASEPGKRQMIRGSITIGEGCYIGSGAIVCVSRKCKDIKIGDYSVIGALSYIDDSVPANMLIHPRLVYERRMRFACKVSKDGCSRESCQILGANWINCGYRTQK